ncbi:MAG: amino acid adenylation domain-containing protein [Polaribacter sp.]
MNNNNSSSKPSLLSRWKNRDKKQVQKNEITKIGENSTIPLSREQKRLWFLQQLNPTNSFYNYAELYRLEGGINVPLFEKSIRFIEDKHDIIKSRFIIEEGVPTVKIASESLSKFTYFDFSDSDFETASKKADKVVQKNANHTFQLSEEALLQSTIIKIAKDNYLFLVVMHHIITDKWSMKIFRKELAENYSFLLKGSTPKIEKPEIQYASYSNWQQNKPINKEHLSYWRQKLSGEIPTLNLTTDFPKKTQPSYKGRFDKQIYKEKTSKAFFELCKKVDATPYVTMLTIYYVLLQKYSGQEDILIGTPITKREQTSLENLIGFFNDTLVLRNSIDKSLSFKALVKDVKKTVLDAFSNKEIYFDTLVKNIKPKRSLHIHPFFQVMFLYHKVPETPKLADDIQISYEPYDAGVAKFDLTLYISEDEGSLTSLMEYETDLFEASTIKRMHKHFGIILNKVIENPEEIISKISIHTAEENQFYKTIEEPVNTYKIPQKGIHEIIIAQAEKNPNAIALVFKETSITYGDLDEKSNKIAAELLKKGVIKNDIIGLSIERSHNMIIGLLGILKAGAAYLPLDPEYPIERTSYILDNAAAKFVITQEEFSLNFTNSSAQILTLEAIEKQEIDTKIELPKVDEEDLAYIIYTSGSTGKPKGVAITHKNIINSTLARTDFYGSDPSSFLLMSSISFDSSKTGIFWSLCSGSKLVISEKHLEQDIERLTNTIYTNKVSHTLMLPSLYNQLVNYGDIEKLTSLHTVIVAGEACTTQLVVSHFKILTNVNLYNEYGPTESTVWCIAHKITYEDANKNSIPIGLPIKNIQVFILDDELQKVPFGAVGELYIGGLGLAKGYLNDAEKTKKSFIKKPSDNLKRIYKTGDLAKYNADGTIAFLGRKDQQVKIRGYRIELDEIEQQIYNNSKVEQAIVVVENEFDTVDWETLEEEKSPQLMQLLNKHIVNKELQQILASVEEISEEALDVVLNNLDS